MFQEIGSRQSIASNVARNLKKKKKKVEEKMPLSFGDTELTSDLCKSCFYQTPRAEVRRGFYPCDKRLLISNNSVLHKPNDLIFF